MEAMGYRRGRLGARWRAVATGGAAALVAAGLAVGASAAAGATPAINRTWSVTLNDAGAPVALSSPVVADLPGGPAAVVGDRAGHVYAAYLANGNEVPGWPVNTGGIPVDSPPSTGSGLVFFGAGNAADPHAGGAYAVNAGGQVVWSHIEHDPVYNSYQPNGMSAGVTTGTLQGQPAEVAPSLGQQSDAYNSGGGELGGFPWFQGDTNFATAAIGDVEGNGQNQIVLGGASTAGIAYGQTYTGGGHIRILDQTGNAGQAQPNQGLVCEYDTTQDVASSPAVGEFLGGSQVGIVAGTGSDAAYAGTSQNDSIIAVNKACNRVWSDRLDGDTSSSPALADVLGNGGLQVVEGTNNGSGGGSVYALNGTNGAVIWRAPAMGEVIGSVVTADLFGTGYQDVIVPTTAGVEILDGRSGAQVATVETGVGIQSAPLVTDDPNGSIGITVAGYNGNNQGVIEHFEVAGSQGSVVNEQGAWPEFHHDPQLTGNAGTPPPVTNVPCKAPAGAPAGYYETASDGGLFNFGNLPFCGSLGAISLNAPVVAMAATSNGGGYWMAAADGGVFGFGNAAFHGSLGSIHLNAPIVGMAPTPDGGGYWLVARDGGVFNFGDAGFYGSLGNLHLNAPIVGMTPTTSGHGYWLVASDGGVFNFGDAGFHGSTGNIHLNKPVVGMAADRATGGYWLVATDGGVFNFDAPFYGSTGNVALNKPVVAMASDSSSGGYWLVASDGGVFNFGNAPFHGSMGGTPLNEPVVAAAGF